MQVIKNVLEVNNVHYPVERLSKTDEILFIDIETTGFTAKTSDIYLIGCVYFSEGSYRTIQFFADGPEDEKELLTQFFSFAKDYNFLVHFNGNNFDIPFILAKCEQHELPYNFDTFKGLDIYKRIACFKDILGLENCKQKTIEAFLNINREDKYSGGDLIGIYRDYVTTKNEEEKRLLLLHNFDDVCGMLDVLPILSYPDILESELTVTSASANEYKDYHGELKTQLIMCTDLSVPVPKPLSCHRDGCFISINDSQVTIKVPLYTEEMKYFYANYKDYYYLPTEDLALHKSVASFVDNEHRKQATAATCYTRITSRFLPQWNNEITPFFKRDYEAKEIFFELTDERKTDRALFNKYASHVINHVISKR